MTRQTPANATPADPETVVIDTPLGSLRGAVRDGVSVFKGIPYAASTAARQRFLPPQPPAPWRGVRDALDPGPRAPQAERAYLPCFDWLASCTPQSEDCLSLNVFTPAPDGAGRPVMVYLHGGAFAFGSSAQPVLDGSRLARLGDVVVVTVNHRLNVFGYLCAQDCKDARFADAGNAGMLDLVAALQWVREHIGAFGGDAGCVTLFGQSGGGAKVAILMAMPAAEGLFHRAIVQSASSGFLVQEPDEAARSTRRLLDQFGLGSSQFTELQNVPAERLLAAMQAVVATEGGHDQFRPVVDGRSILRQPFFPDAPEQARHIPLLIGSTGSEATYYLADNVANFALPMASVRARIKRFMKLDDAQTDAVIAAYAKHHPGAAPSELLTAIASDHMYRCPTLVGAERKTEQGGAPVFVYEFAWQSAAMDGVLRSPHTAELPFVLDNVGVAARFTGNGEAEQSLAQRTALAWTRFARTGNPNGDGLPAWPAYDLERRATMRLDLEPRVVADPNGDDRRTMAEFPHFLPGSAITFRAD